MREPFHLRRVKVAVPSPKKFRRRQRDKIVSKIRCGSVESRIRTDLPGGSSSVFKKALAG